MYTQTMSSYVGVGWGAGTKRAGEREKPICVPMQGADRADTCVPACTQSSALEETPLREET